MGLTETDGDDSLYELVKESVAEMKRKGSGAFPDGLTLRVGAVAVNNGETADGE